MTELNPFSHQEKENSITINENYTESVSENDYEFTSLDCYPSFNSLDSSYPVSPNKKFPAFLKKSIFLPDLFLEKKNIQKYICSLCDNVCDEVVKPACKCGKYFCKSCLTIFYEKEQKCPLCEDPTKGELIEAKIEDKYIKSQKMKCVNYINNCKWEGECENYKSHIVTYCPEEIVNCPNKNHGCVIKFKRKGLLDHLKICEYQPIHCDKCKLSYPIKEKDSHKDICENEIVICPFNCGNELFRKELEMHKVNCDFAVIKCPFNSLGCKDEFKKRDEKKRLNEERDKHMELIKDKILSFQNLFEQIDKRIKNMEENIQILKSNNINNNENNISLLSHKRKNPLNKEEDDDSRLNEEEKNSECHITKSNNSDENSIPLNENDHIYDLLEETKKFFFVKNNMIEAMNLKEMKHYYVFFDKKYDIPRNSEKQHIIRFKLLSNTKWLAMGLCDRKLVQENNYEFLPDNNKKEKSIKKCNNGTYSFSTNKMAWNCNNSRQCKTLKFDGDSGINKKDSIFEFRVIPVECELEIYLNTKFVIKFNDVRCFKNNVFSPCLIFLKNCKVETNFAVNEKNC